MLPSDSCTKLSLLFEKKESKPSSLSSVQPSPWASFEYLIPGFRPGEFVLQFTHDAVSLSERRVYLRCGLLFLMAIARAFFVPIMMTSFLALVIPV
jgi:hypothetical protein